MGYVLVKANGQPQQQQSAPMFNAGFTGPQVSMGGPGQAFVQLDATYQPWLRDRKDQNKTVSFPEDEHFLNPFTNQIEPSPLAGTTEANPNFGSSIDSKVARAGMGAAQLAGLGLGAYSALMNFADDSTQDPVSSALGALGAGYITYAQLAPVANYLAGRGDARLANALEDYKQNRSSQEFLSQNLASTGSPPRRTYSQSPPGATPPAPSTPPAPFGNLPTLDPATKPPVKVSTPKIDFSRGLSVRHRPSDSPLPTPNPATKPESDLGTFESDVSLGEPDGKKVAVKRKKEEDKEDESKRQTKLSDRWRSGYGG